jgi:hypothetical protein
MSDLGVQLSLPRPMMELQDELIRRPKDLLRAFVMSADMGGLEDKQAAAAAGMDPATWSRFKQGDVGIRPNNFMSFREQCGNDLPLAHWAYRCGYGLHPLESELERRLRIERERNERIEAENKMLKNLLAGRPAD